MSAFLFSFQSKPRERHAEHCSKHNAYRFGHRRCWVGREAMHDPSINVKQSVHDRPGRTRGCQHCSVAPLARAEDQSDAAGKEDKADIAHEVRIDHAAPAWFGQRS
jgi:hypothetical protein